MLSICIPTYRYDVRPLVAELLRQAEKIKFDGSLEILVYDDASPDDGDWGREELRQTGGIHYVELEANLGRAAIRNKMASEASHTYLVMMDADGWPNAGFVRHWINIADEREQLPTSYPFVVVGGRNYAANPPEKNESNLHWWYGTHRESPSQKLRTEMGALGFQSNNFGVERELLLKYPFDDTHQGYGHEDTLWGQQLVWAGFHVAHIDNPVVHLGLEPNDVFLRKQRQAIDNLRLLKNQSPHLRTRLIDLIEKLPFLPAIVRLIPEQTLINHLSRQKRPNLYALDLLKLRWWRS
jgi:glycosyltransferase involved in cell wall biosynthesis